MKRKTLSLVMVSLITSSILASCKSKVGQNEYTYRTSTTALGTKWDPCDWETNADNDLLGYISEPLLDIAPLDTEKESWQWIYCAATAATDVTSSRREDLVKYGIIKDSASDDDTPKEGYVFEIKLNPEVQFEKKTINGKEYGGKKITADDYIESAKILLDPQRKNYRANLFYEAESAMVGAFNYYYQGSEGYFASSTIYSGSYSSDNDANLVFCISGKVGDTEVFTKNAVENMFEEASYSYAQSVSYINSQAGLSGDQSVASLEGKTLAEIKADTTLNAIWEAVFAWWKPSSNNEILDFCVTKSVLPEQSFDTVGLYKVDDLTIRYVTASKDTINDFRTHLTSNWLVETNLYKDLSSTDSTGLLVSQYNKSVGNTISFGPYRMSSYENEKQVVFEQNTDWWGYTKDSNGKLVSTTNFDVNGSKVRQWQTTKITIDVLEPATAKLQFESGDLNDYEPTPEELSDYSLSSQLYQVDETYTDSYFFDANLDDLKKMDANNTTKNGVVLSNYNFRKAFSLAIDRRDYVTNTAGFKPAFSLMNSLYYYDIYGNPESQYRKTSQAKQALVDLYNIEYGSGKTYETLDAAHDSITGYNLDLAKQLFKTAHDELVADGLYTSGQDINIKIAYKAGALADDDFARIAATNKYVEAARQGSGFGKITFEAVGNLTDRYGDVGTRGVYPIGRGAWGGAAFYPYRNMQVYMDPDSYSLHEGRSWAPKTETLTINNIPDGNGGTFSDSLTYQAWSKSLTGKYASRPDETKLYILSRLEYEFLNKFYRIPLAGYTSCFLLGYQQHYFTQKYNIMYDFGGLRLTVYDYDDAQWAAYVKKNKGSLNYK